MIVTLILALLAGIAGAMIGVKLGSTGAAPDDSLHSLLHDDLKLSPRQNQAIELEEDAFRRRRAAFERRTRLANGELARAIGTAKRDGPEVQRAIDHIHHALGEYQKESVAHIFRMRAVLTPTQAEAFDRAVADALTKDAR